MMLRIRFSESEAEFRHLSPATVAETAARLAALTGMARRPTQVRPLLHAWGRNPRQVGMLPATADVDAQAAWTKTMWSHGSPKPQRAHACAQRGARGHTVANC